MSETSDTVGQALQLSLTAIGSGREITTGSLGVPALFICFGQETQAGTEAVENVARELYPSHRRLVVAHVVDLHKIPSMFRKVAEGVLGTEHKKAVESLPAGAAPDNYVIILPDWDGSAVRALGLDDATKAIGLALIDSAGRVVWRHQGQDSADALRQRLEAQPLE